ncbi:unnamed protein product [Adineta steineri]|uniref:Uncharacterized protein n=1 Tax=Adineta steineri TaxID=433720 RepID=A0A819T6T9_9BILA|nr:unnamed protein product [Adineta steineri]CAF1368485.1 unnamed protein product [Adineta steineri]CAF3838199.1 unnamed protein product [Adineta steineri]CAF4070200.1 unnamed protein product [Adineta steineri]
MVETVVPSYCTAYKTLNEDIVEKLLAADIESDEAAIEALVNSLLCGAKNVRNQLHKATNATEHIRITIDEQITQLVLSISSQEERVRQSEEAIQQASNNIQHSQRQLDMAQAAVHDSHNSVNAANHAVHEAEEEVRQAHICGMGRRKRRDLEDFFSNLNPIKIFREVVGKPLCSVINSGSIDNAKERRALAHQNLHHANERLHTHQQNLNTQRAQYNAAQAQHHAANIQLQSMTSALNEQRAKQSLVASLTKQLKDVEVHLNKVLGSSTVLQDEMSQLIDFDLVIEPLNNIYDEMIKNNIMKSFGFAISAETANDICSLSVAYEQCSVYMALNDYFQDLYTVIPQLNSSSNESKSGMSLKTMNVC